MLQRRKAHFVFSKGPMDHIGTAELKLLLRLTVPDHVKYFKLVHVFRIRAGLAPSYLSAHFKPITLVHGYSTRGHFYGYHVSKGMSLAPTSFAYTAVACWNALPDSLKAFQLLSLFKSKLKIHLSSHY